MKKVRIRSYRSLVDTGEINIEGDMTVLIGRNEQGKTNFLRALESFDRDAEYGDEDLSYLVPHPGSPGEIPIVTAWFELSDEERDKLASSYKEFAKVRNLTVTKYFDNHYVIEGPNVERFKSGLDESIGKIVNTLKRTLKKNARLFSLIDELDKDSHISWLKSLQNDDGGFANTPGEQSHIVFTFLAFRTLEALGRTTVRMRKKVLQYVLSTEHPDGGFGHQPNQTPQGHWTYCAIAILSDLDSVSDVSRKMHINWLRSLQNPDGGFGGTPDGASHISEADFAVRSLMKLKGLAQIDKEKLIKYILSAEHEGGGFGYIAGQRAQSDFTYRGIMLLRRLRAIGRIDKDVHTQWLLSLHNEDGGFGHIPGKASNLTHTSYVVKALDGLGQLSEVKSEDLIEFIKSLQGTNGGFTHTPRKSSQVQFTYEAISTLLLLQSNSDETIAEAIEELPISSNTERMNDLVDALLGVISNFSSSEAVSLAEMIGEERMRIGEYLPGSLTNSVMNLMPSFIYSDSVENIGNKVNINDYLRTEGQNEPFSNLFKISGLDILEVTKTVDPHTRKRMFRDASDKITGLIDELWEQEDIKVGIEIDGNEILVCIEDGAGAKADPPSRRSDGFVWFLSFFLKFRAESEGNLKNSILLLDNPGWRLHPSGQKNLLETLDEMVKNNQILLATHSPFLIDKNKLERIRIATRESNEGSKIIEKFWVSLHDSLDVIRASIGASISDSLFGHKNNIIVEGQSDVLYLEAILSYLKKKKKKKTLDLDEVMIVGAGGADKIGYLLSWYKAEKYKSLAVLDNDAKGEKVRSDIKRKDLGVDAEKDIILLGDTNEEFKGRCISMEDLFDEEFFCLAVSRAYRESLSEVIKDGVITAQDLPSEGPIVKRFGLFFEENGIGSLDKVKIGLEIKKILTSKDVDKLELGDTIKNFEGLVQKIWEKFKSE